MRTGRTGAVDVAEGTFTVSGFEITVDDLGSDIMEQPCATNRATPPNSALVTPVSFMCNRALEIE